jgi:hypothetical protein
MKINKFRNKIIQFLNLRLLLIEQFFKLAFMFYKFQLVFLSSVTPANEIEEESSV